MKVVPLMACAAAMIMTAACGPEKTVPGSAAGTGEDLTTTVRETTTQEPAEPTEASSPSEQAETAAPTRAPGGFPPLTVDESLPAQYCEREFEGALDKPMLAVVVETPGGILNCEEAAAILFDYYAERPTPAFDLDPFLIGPLACNQGEEGRLAQVICADEDNLIYSMWPQT